MFETRGKCTLFELRCEMLIVEIRIARDYWYRVRKEAQRGLSHVEGGNR